MSTDEFERSVDEKNSFRHQFIQLPTNNRLSSLSVDFPGTEAQRAQNHLFVRAQASSCPTTFAATKMLNRCMS